MLGRAGGGGNFFSLVPNVFPLCSIYRFPSGFQYVPQVPNLFPNMFSIALHFYPICFGKCCPPFSPIWVGQREGTLYFRIEPPILGNLHSFNFFE
jgi:hypothetical protein